MSYISWSQQSSRKLQGTGRFDAATVRETRIWQPCLCPELPPSFVLCLSLWGHRCAIQSQGRKNDWLGCSFSRVTTSELREPGLWESSSDRTSPFRGRTTSRPRLYVTASSLRGSGLAPEDTVLQPAHLVFTHGWIVSRLTLTCYMPWTPWDKCSVEPRTCVHLSRSLTLEWNNLGMWDDAFATFCGGLAANSTLRQLDLRNNQISHKGAEELALALKGNTTLQQLGEVS